MRGVHDQKILGVQDRQRLVEVPMPLHDLHIAPILRDYTKSVRFMLALGVLKHQVDCNYCERGVMSIKACSETKYESGIAYMCWVCKKFTCLAKKATCYWPKGLKP